MTRYQLAPRFLILAAAAVALLATASPPASARPNFLKEFKKFYITDKTSEEFSELVGKKAKCYVCHQGRNKKNRNVYGQEITKLVKKKEKDSEKIIAALKKVGEMKTDPKDKKSPTYAELIAKGKLPGGTLEEVKKEPAKDDKKKEDKDDKKDDKKEEGSDKKG